MAALLDRWGLWVPALTWYNITAGVTLRMRELSQHRNIQGRPCLLMNPWHLTPAQKSRLHAREWGGGQTSQPSMQGESDQPNGREEDQGILIPGIGFPLWPWFINICSYLPTGRISTFSRGKIWYTAARLKKITVSPTYISNVHLKNFTLNFNRNLHSTGRNT